MPKYLIPYLFFVVALLAFIGNFLFIYWSQWLIYEPWPYSNFGSAPVQLLILISLTLLAILFFITGLYIKKQIDKK